MTFYLCMECGQRDSFRGTQNITEYCTEDITFNGEGDINDWGDRDCYESEVTDGPNDVECSECISGNVEEFDDEVEIELKQAEVLGVIEEESIPAPQRDWKAELGE